MNIVVVGGGFGGVKTALELSNKPGIHVMLLVANNNFEYHGALYRTATGRSPLEVIIPLRDIFKQSKNVEIILDKMASINAQKQYITSETGNTYRYDKAVLSLGNVVNYFGIEGMQNNSFAINMITSNIALRHALVKLFKTHKHPKIVIVGAGPSGVELAGELQNFASMVSERYGKTAARVDTVLIEGTDKVLPLMGERVSKIALKRLQSLGVEVMLNTRVNMCQPGKICLESRDLSADIIVWTAGSKPVDIYASQPEVFKLDRGRVVVDDYLRASGQEAIYVIGDNASTKYTGMAPTALHNAVYVAKHILGNEKEAYSPKLPAYVVPIGPNWAVYKQGDKVYSGYRGWLVRRRADLDIYRNFEPYKAAIRSWRKVNKKALF